MLNGNQKINSEYKNISARKVVVIFKFVDIPPSFSLSLSLFPYLHPSVPISLPPSLSLFHPPSLPPSLPLLLSLPRLSLPPSLPLSLLLFPSPSLPHSLSSSLSLSLSRAHSFFPPILDPTSRSSCKRARRALKSFDNWDDLLKFSH